MKKSWRIPFLRPCVNSEMSSNCLETFLLKLNDELGLENSSPSEITSNLKRAEKSFESNDPKITAAQIATENLNPLKTLEEKQIETFFDRILFSIVLSVLLCVVFVSSVFLFPSLPAFIVLFVTAVSVSIGIWIIQTFLSVDTSTELEELPNLKDIEENRLNLSLCSYANTL